VFAEQHCLVYDQPQLPHQAYYTEIIVKAKNSQPSRMHIRRTTRSIAQHTYLSCQSSYMYVVWLTESMCVPYTD